MKTIEFTLTRGYDLKEEYREMILKEIALQAKLMLATNKSFATIRRWAVENTQMLTTKAVLETISKHLIEKNEKIELPTK